MKKLLIASLVSAMLVAFSGMANAADWWESATKITCGVTLTDELTGGKGNTVLITKSGIFKGSMVMETSSETADAGTIDEIFLCGTVTTGTKVTEVEVLFSSSPTPFAVVATDFVTLATKAHTEAGHIIGTGTFTDQTNTLTGPAYLNAGATFNENNTDTITSMIIDAVVAGGYGQTATKTGLFSQAFSTDLKPLTLGTGKTTVTCVAGVVTQD